MLGKLERYGNHRDFGYCRRIRVVQFEGEMHRMSRGRETEPDKIPVKFYKSASKAIRMAL